jgi:hypothetical protein
MRKRRIWRLARAVEARYPGARVVVERWGDPEDPAVHWFLEVLNVRGRDKSLVWDLVETLAEKRFGMELPFCFGVSNLRETREYLASRMERRRARRIRARTLLAPRAAG